MITTSLTTNASSKKKLAGVLLTAAFGVCTEFLVREFRHLPSSFRGWQQKPHGKSQPEFARHVCTVCERTQWSYVLALCLVNVLWAFCSFLAVCHPREGGVVIPFSTPPAPASYLSTHRAPFKAFKQVNRMGDEEEEGQIRQTPACVLTFPLSIPRPVSPPLRQQSVRRCSNTFLRVNQCFSCLVQPLDVRAAVILQQTHHCSCPLSLVCSSLCLLSLPFKLRRWSHWLYLHTVCFHCQGNQLSLSCANTPKHTHTHTLTYIRTLTKQEDYTCLVWVGWELPGKTHLIFVPSKPGRTWVNTLSVRSHNGNRWCWSRNELITLLLNDFEWGDNMVSWQREALTGEMADGDVRPKFSSNRQKLYRYNPAVIGNSDVW